IIILFVSMTPTISDDSVIAPENSVKDFRSQFIIADVCERIYSFLHINSACSCLRLSDSSFTASSFAFGSIVKLFKRFSKQEIRLLSFSRKGADSFSAIAIAFPTIGGTIHSASLGSSSSLYVLPFSQQYSSSSNPRCCKKQPI